MPQVDPTEYESLPLRARALIDGFGLHDVWSVDLSGTRRCTIPDLLRLIESGRAESVGPLVRGLFRMRSWLGRIFRLDERLESAPRSTLQDRVPVELADESLVPTGTPQGPFTTLYVLPAEGAFEALNATVHAILVVALVESQRGQRLVWATHVKPVGRITRFYMGLIDPFRRAIVYPGLESWLKRAWNETL